MDIGGIIMKKKYPVITGLLILALAAAGCGSTGKEPAKKASEITVTPAPSPEPEITSPPMGNLVEMEKVEEPDEYDDVKNIIGEKTESASRVLIINQTRAPIEHIFIRAAAKDDGSSDEWGTELTHDFEWADGEEALYYYENNHVDLEGNTATSYDIRISYEDINEEELYFRNLPLPLMKELRLCIDVSGSFALPYARYITINGNREYSTLQEVRAWYGLDVEEDEDEKEDERDDEKDEDEDDKEDDDETSVTPTPVPEAGTTESTSASTTEASTEATTEADNSSGSQPEPSESDYDEPDYGATQASQYIGRSFSSLESALGSPSGSEYDETPGLGSTGYHYYGTFTVSTVIDENGNEIVSGVW